LVRLWFQKLVGDNILTEDFYGFPTPLQEDTGTGLYNRPHPLTFSHLSFIIIPRFFHYTTYAVEKALLNKLRNKQSGT
jgi:hypothetical protein